jgi:hypothetical protein
MEDFGIVVLVLVVGMVCWGAIKEAIQKHRGDNIGLEDKIVRGLKTIFGGAEITVYSIGIIGV